LKQNSIYIVNAKEHSPIFMGQPMSAWSRDTFLKLILLINLLHTM
jgi:hypothetical protein